MTAREVDSDRYDRETLFLPGLDVLADILKYIEIDLGYDTRVSSESDEFLGRHDLAVQRPSCQSFCSMETGLVFKTDNRLVVNEELVLI